TFVFNRGSQVFGDTSIATILQPKICGRVRAAPNCNRRTKLVEIVGEAAKLISEDTRQRYPEVPWSRAARTRDRLVHHYFDIDLDALWSTITTDGRGRS